MAGLVAAARARELGASPVVYEKGSRAGGSMLLSSCVIWRYSSFDEFRRQCPGGDERLQRLVWERLDDALDWLESLGAPVIQAETENPLTTGRRFDPHGLTGALVRAAGEVRLEETAAEPAILATGGFQGSPELVAEHIRPAAPLARSAPIRGAPETAFEPGSAAAARSRRAWTSSTAATCPTRRSARRTSCPPPSSMPPAHGS